MDRGADVEFGAVICCFDPVDIGDAHDLLALAQAHRNAGQVLGVQCLLHETRQLPHLTIAHDVLRTLQSFYKCGVGKGLHEIVERVDAERLERELFVRGDKDDRWHALGADCANHAEAVDLRHLHVKQDEIGIERLDGFDRGLAVAAVAHTLELRIAPDQLAQSRARERLVVNDEDVES
jgi:hypothetical protein